MIFVTRCEVYPPLEATVVSCCYDKCPDQKPPGKGRTLSYRLPPIIKEGQGGNFMEELEGETLLERMALTVLLPLTFLGWLSYPSQALLLEMYCPQWTGHSHIDSSF